MMPDGHATQATEKALLPNKALNEAARELDILPDLKHNSLLSVVKLADAGYTTIFHVGDGGVTVHWANDIHIRVDKKAILQGWRDKASGLWRVPIKPNVENENTDTLVIDRPAPSHAAHNVYELPTIEQTVRYLHGALGFPTKATLVKVIRNKWLVGWPALTVENEPILP